MNEAPEPDTLTSNRAPELEPPISTNPGGRGEEARPCNSPCKEANDILTAVVRPAVLDAVEAAIDRKLSPMVQGFHDAVAALRKIADAGVDHNDVIQLRERTNALEARLGELEARLNALPCVHRHPVSCVADTERPFVDAAEPGGEG